MGRVRVKRAPMGRLSGRCKGKEASTRGRCVYGPAIGRVWAYGSAMASKGQTHTWTRRGNSLPPSRHSTQKTEISMFCCQKISARCASCAKRRSEDHASDPQRPTTDHFTDRRFLWARCRGVVNNAGKMCEVEPLLVLSWSNKKAKDSTAVGVRGEEREGESKPGEDRGKIYHERKTRTREQTAINKGDNKGNRGNTGT